MKIGSLTHIILKGNPVCNISKPVNRHHFNQSSIICHQRYKGSPRGELAQIMMIIRRSYFLFPKNHLKKTSTHAKSISTSSSSLTRTSRSFSSQSIHVQIRDLWKPTLVTVALAGFSYVAAIIWDYESLRNKSFNIWNNKYNPLINKQNKRGDYRNQISEYWSQLREGEKVAICIGAVNLAVFAMWKIKRLVPFMTKYFLGHTLKKPLYAPMFLSTFSHTSFAHLAINMYVLYSFAKPSVDYLGKEQFMALYVSAGMFGSLLSLTTKVLRGTPGLSVGASGAILGPIAALCILQPDAQLGIVFLPFFNVPAGLAIKGLIALDATGLIMNWRFFDHAAHLGGSLFGIVSIKYGQDVYAHYRSVLFKEWHQIRNSLKSSKK